jgi:hypothetical protein
MLWLPVKILQTPIKIGKEWKTAEWDSLWGYNLGKAKIISTDTTITTRAGTFHHVITVESSDSLEFSKMSWYIAPGIGVIQSQYSEPLWFRTSQLIAWKIK